MEKYKVVSKWHELNSSVKELEINTKCQIYSKLQNHYYGQMRNRLNEMPGNLRNVYGEFEEVGYLLRELWRKYENRLVIHETKIKGGIHEQEFIEYLQELGVTRDEIAGMTEQQIMNHLEHEYRINDKYKEYFNASRFDKNGNVWGAYTDLIYDTNTKDWTKPYQYTFHEIFHNIDYLANAMGDNYFSHTYKKKKFKHHDTECQFGEIIKEDAFNLKKDNAAALIAIENLPKHDKAPLYDVIGGALRMNVYTNTYRRVREQFGHDSDYWRSDGNRISRLLAQEAFAHMASTAVVNPKALEATKDYLINSYRMFVEILRQMADGTYTIIYSR